MTKERLYSTRELAQLWNVSETTIKRWTFNKELGCFKTPGGHRRFRVSDIVEFQGRRGFEASGILIGAASDFSDLEIWINTKNFSKIRQLIYTLALHNRITEITESLNRLYLRGVLLADFYNEILIDLEKNGKNDEREIDLSGYRLNLVRSNLNSAFHFFNRSLDPGKHNGRTALCVSPVSNSGLPLQLMACVFREQGWESLVLREPCDLRTTRECVKREPVSLLAFWIPVDYEPEPENEEREKLVRFLNQYRVPVVVVQEKPHSRALKKYYTDGGLKTFQQFQRYVKVMA